MSQKPINDRPAAYAVEVAKVVAGFGIHGIAAFFTKFAEELHKRRPDVDVGVKVEKP